MLSCHSGMEVEVSPYSKSKREKKKRNINNDLVVLPSHDIFPL